MINTMYNVYFSPLTKPNYDDDKIRMFVFAISSALMENTFQRKWLQNYLHVKKQARLQGQKGL
jgi:hypothetical protein